MSFSLSVFLLQLKLLDGLLEGGKLAVGKKEKRDKSRISLRGDLTKKRGDATNLSSSETLRKTIETEGQHEFNNERA